MTVLYVIAHYRKFSMKKLVRKVRDEEVSVEGSIGATCGD
jgi:hypothetical protein